MAMGKRKRDRQPTMWVPTTDLPTTASHPFYRRLNQLLREYGFDDKKEGFMAGSSVRTVFLLLPALVVLSRQPAEAQTLTGSAFAGVGAFACCAGATPAFEVGAGLERAISPHVSIDGEFGLAVPAGNGTIVRRSGELTDTMNFNTGAFGFFNVFYHVDRGSSRLRPFVTGGVGCVVSCLIAGPAFGAGADLWLRDGDGVRVEVRDQLMGEFGVTHLITVRIGWVFRSRT